MDLHTSRRQTSPKLYIVKNKGWQFIQILTVNKKEKKLQKKTKQNKKQTNKQTNNKQNKQKKKNNKKKKKTKKKRVNKSYFPKWRYWRYPGNFYRNYFLQENMTNLLSINFVMSMQSC